jgi:hypothetical protein
MSMSACFAAWRVAALVSLALIAALVPVHAMAQAKPLIPIYPNTLETVQIERKGSLGRTCLHSERAHASVATATCTVVGAQQTWMFRRTAIPLMFEIYNLRTGGCLDVEGANRSRGALVLDWPCHGGLQQRWRVLARGEYERSHVLLQSVHSGLCIESENGALRMRDCYAEQGGVPVFSLLYSIQRVARQSPNGSPIQVVRGGLCMGQDGTRTFLAGCHAAGTRFWFEPENLVDSTFRLATSKALDQCVVVERAVDGYDYAVMRSCSDARARKDFWRLDASGNAWQYRHMPTGRCLNAQFGMAHAGTRLIVWPCAPASDNARWYYAAH